MNEEANDQNADIVPPSQTGGKKVILPSAAINQEQTVQQQAAPPSVVVAPNPQPIAMPQPVYSPSTPAASDQIQVGMSASQMGFNEPKSKLFDFNFNPKKLLIKGLVALVIVGGIFAALIAMNIIALSEFKTTSYVNNKGTQFKFVFYAKHTSKELASGNTQLISKVSKDGKFPLALSITTSDSTSSGYSRAKDCTSFAKVVDVQNNNLDQKISVCDIQSGTQVSGRDASDTVYIAGFMHSNQAYIITIGQDYSDIDLTSKSGAQESLTRFGMKPYKEDIEKIISSIKIE